MLSIDEIKETLTKYFQQKPISKAWIFGSFARGEQTKESDIDILVDFDKDEYPSLLSHVRMISDLEELLGIKIDLVPRDQVFSILKPRIESEKQLIYERN